MTEDTPTKTSVSSEFDKCEKEGKRIVMTMMKEKKQNWRTIQEGLLPRLLALSRTREDLNKCKMLAMSSITFNTTIDDSEKETQKEEEEAFRKRLMKQFVLLSMQQQEEDAKYSSAEAKFIAKLLKEEKYLFCLNREEILRYGKDRVDLGPVVNVAEEKKQKKKSNDDDGENVQQQEMIYAKMFDDVFPTSTLRMMQKQFGDVQSPFWTQHEYFNREKKNSQRQFFSYVHDIVVGENEEERTNNFSSTMDVVIEYAKCVAGRAFPRVLREATKAEWWCHNRAHCEGHQMHFDSDDEGINGLRHPICSVVVFISANGEMMEDERNKNNKRQRTTTSENPAAFVGGPTLVTTQRDGDQKNTNFNEINGWLAYPKTNRCVVFDGELLHGVVPGRGLNAFINNDSYTDEKSTPLPTRTTLMIAFWDDIEVRGSIGSIGSARAFPTYQQVKDEKAHWRNLFNIEDIEEESGVIQDRTEIEKRALRAPEMYLVPVEKVWHPLNEFAKEMITLPNYDRCFQGF